jgi:hypothetical protein
MGGVRLWLKLIGAALPRQPGRVRRPPPPPARVLPKGPAPPRPRYQAGGSGKSRQTPARIARTNRAPAGHNQSRQIRPEHFGRFPVGAMAAARGRGQRRPPGVG